MIIMREMWKSDWKSVQAGYRAPSWKTIWAEVQRIRFAQTPYWRMLQSSGAAIEKCNQDQDDPETSLEPDDMQCVLDPWREFTDHVMAPMKKVGLRRGVRWCAGLRTGGS